MMVHYSDKSLNTPDIIHCQHELNCIRCVAALLVCPESGADGVDLFILSDKSTLTICTSMAIVTCSAVLCWSLGRNA